MSFEIITSIGAAASIGVVANLTYDLLNRLARIRKLSNSVEDAKTDAALASGDIDTIGRYIYDDLGSIRLKDFTLNKDIEGKLNAVIDKVEDFFGSAEDAPDQSPRSESTPEINLSGLPDEYDVFLDELRRGELWNCLAKLRLFAEQKLGTLAAVEGLDVSHQRSARQLLRALSISVPLDNEILSHLDYAITIANRAIHGEEVEDDIALEAVQSAIVAFERLNKPKSEQAVPPKSDRAGG